MSNRYVAYEGNIGGNIIKQIRRSAFETQSQVVRTGATGALKDAMIAGSQADPRATFESGDLPGVLGAINIGTTNPGLAVASGTVEIPWNKRANGGVFAAAGNHMILSGTDGLAMIRQIAASQGDDGATATVEFMFHSSDGLTDPITENSGASLSSSSFNATHALGPVKANGSELPGVSSVTVNTGWEFQPIRDDAEVYPVAIALQAPAQPTIDVTFSDLAQLATYNSIFKALTSFDVFFRKRKHKGTFVGAATAEHVSISFSSGGVFDVQDVTGSAGEDAQVTLRVHGDELSVSTATAI